MIELPQATVIARQMDAELHGARIVAGNRGNAEHKFAFSNGTGEEYAEILQDRTVGEVTAHGSAILMPITGDYTLAFGGGGERILLHEAGVKKLPKKYHLWLQFADDRQLTVTVQGWGNTLLLDSEQAVKHPHMGHGRVAALDEAFTLEVFMRYFEGLPETSKGSLKYMLISEPGVWGIGNGCLQDILFNARLHPKQPARETTTEERKRLYTAIRETLTQMIAQGGRDCERDLYNRRGGYQRILYSKTAGEPCPRCTAPIAKASYLGGTVYFCPACQPYA